MLLISAFEAFMHKVDRPGKASKISFIAIASKSQLLSKNVKVR